MYTRFLRQERVRHEKENIDFEQQNLAGQKSGAIFEITEAVVPTNVLKKKNRSNSLKTFIPFIQERDSIGRLIGVNQDTARKSARSTNNNISRISPLLKTTRRRDSSPPPRLTSQSLSRLLDLDIENCLNQGKRQEAAISQTDRNLDFTDFRAAESICEKPIYPLKRKTSQQQIKPSRAFSSVSREQLNLIQAKKMAKGAEICRFDASLTDIIHPKVPNVFISKTRDPKNESISHEEDHYFLGNASLNYQPKNVVDFSKQISRELRDRILTMHEIVIKKEAKPKDEKEMDQDFRVAKSIREKYILTSAKKPRTLNLKPKLMPLSSNKINEITKKIVRAHGLGENREVLKILNNRMRGSLTERD